MKEKCFTNPLRGAAGMLRKGIQFAMLSLMLFSISGVQADTKNPNYGFPNNYEYPYGITVTTPKNDKIVELYHKWIENFYVESGDKARIKFIQKNEDGTATVSEGIGYGMLIMVYMADGSDATYDEYDMFKKLWNYYQYNSNANKIMHWKVDAFAGHPVGNEEGNSNGATDAELDVAQALLLAYKQWGDEEFLINGKLMLERIWDFEMDHTMILKPGDAFDDYKNPCYFVTNAMQLFAQVDAGSNRDWNTAVDKAYDFIKLTQNGATGLVPDWVYTDYNWENYSSASSMYISGTEKDKFESYYLYDAIRVQWRMAQAYAWYGHEKAKQICDVANAWSNTQTGGKPGAMVDGYTLGGSPANTTGDPFVAEKGKWSNACFGGGFAAGGVASEKGKDEWRNFMESGYDYAVGEAVDGSSYFVETTQLLYLLFMSGNMPNLYDMLPEFKTAETDAEGATITVYFTKPLLSSSIASSLSGWSVKSDFGSITNQIESITNQGDTAVILAMKDTIMDEYQIVSYDGTAGLKSDEGSDLTQFSTDESVLNATGLSNYQFVTDNRTVKRPIILSASTNMEGDKVFLILDQQLSPRSVRSTYFTLTGKGGRSITIGTAAVDQTETNKIVIGITGDVLTIIQESDGDELLLSYDGRVSSVDGQQLKTFTDRSVLNLVVTQKCTTIDDFDDHENPNGAWLKPWDDKIIEEFDQKASNPDNSGINTDAYCLKYLKTTGSDGQSAPKFTFDNPVNSIWATEGQFQLKFQLYTTNAVGSVLVFHFHNSGDSEKDKFEPGNNLEFSYTVPATALNNWIDVTIDMENEKDFTKEMDEFELSIDKPTTGAGQEIYFDNFKFCTPVPVTELKSALINTSGTGITMKFGDVMGIPADPSEFKIFVKSGTTLIPFAQGADVESVELDPNDPTKLFMTTPANSTFGKTDVVYISYEGSTAKSAGGRPLTHFVEFPVMNGRDRVVTTGWADEFNSTTDYITKSLGDANRVYLINEGDDGTCTITVKADPSGNPYTIYRSFGVTLTDELWDLTNNQKVQLSLKCPDNVYIRVDLKDLVNDRTTDAVPIQQYTGSGSDFQEMTFDVTGLWKNSYDDNGNTGAVDKTAIYQVLIYIWSEVPSATNSYKPTTYIGDVVFDYIRVGAALTLDVAAGANKIDQGETVLAGCNQPCVMYVVPENTTRDIKALEAAVADGKGKKVEAPTANTKVDLDLKDYEGGNYDLYAYDPTTGAISIRQQISIKDINPPILTFIPPTLTGTFELNSYGSVISNEDGWVVMVNADFDFGIISDGSGLLNNPTLPKIAVEANQKVGWKFSMTNEMFGTNGAPNGFILVAVDKNYLISDKTSSFDVVDTKPMNVTILTPVVPFPDASAKDTIKFIASKPGTVYLVLENSPADASHFSTAYDTYINERTIVPGTEQFFLTSDILTLYDWVTDPSYTGDYADSVDAGYYWLYAEDNNGDIWGPFKFICGEAQTNNVATATLDPSADFTLKGVNTTADLSLIITGEDASKPADVQNVLWKSDNENAVGVTGDKLGATVTVLNAGVAKITATITDMGGNTKEVSITVTAEVDVVASSIKVTAPANGTVELLPTKSVTVEATVEPADKVSQAFTLSTDSQYLTIVGNKITAKAVTSEQIATVTVTADASPEGNPVTTEIKVTIPYIQDVVVSIDPSADQTLLVDDELSLVATVLNATDKTVKWSVTLGTGVVSVSESGAVTALKPGAATVTATSNEDGDATASINITVEKRAPKSLTLTPSSHTFILGSSATLEITPVFGVNDLDAVTNKELVWSSDDKAVAVVGSDGVVVPKNTTDVDATCTITAKSKIDDNVYAECTISFSANETPLQNIVASDMTVMEHETGSISFEYDPAGTTQKGVTFESSNNDILYVTEDGAFEAVVEGEVTVTISSTYPGVSVSKQITAKVNPFAVTAVKVAKDNFTLDLADNKTAYIQASFEPDFTPSDLEVTYDVTQGSGKIEVSATGKITAIEATDAGTPAIIRVYSATNKDKYVDVEVVVSAEAATITAVTFDSGIETTVEQGETVDLSNKVTVTGTGAFDNSLTWTISPATKVNDLGNGKFEVNSDATGTFIVTAYSVADNSKSDEITFTINEGVTSIAIDPYDSKVLQGSSFTLSAKAVGGVTNAVKWEALTPGLSITSDGKVIVADDQPLETYRFKVTSVEENSITETVTIEVIKKNTSAKLTSITIPSSITLGYNESKTISATLDGDDYAWVVKWEVVSGTSVSLDGTTGKTNSVEAGSSIGVTTIKATVEQPDGTIVSSNILEVTVKASVQKITGVTDLKDLPTSINAGETIDLADYLRKSPSTADNDLVYELQNTVGITQDGSEFTLDASASGTLIVIVKNAADETLKTVKVEIIRQAVYLEDLSLELDGEAFGTKITLLAGVWSDPFTIVATNWNVATEKAISVDVDDSDIARLTTEKDATSGIVTLKLKGVSSGKTTVTISADEGDAEIELAVTVLDVDDLETLLAKAIKKEKALRDAKDYLGYTAAKELIKVAQKVYDNATSSKPTVTQGDIDDQVEALQGLLGTAAETIATKEVIVSPTPIENTLVISGATVVSATVVNSVGVVALQSNSSTIDVAGLPAGTYTVIIETTEGIVTVPVVK